MPSNSAKIWLKGLPTVLARTLSRPRWDMPITTSRMPCRVASFRIPSRRGIKASPPSRENRLWPMYRVWRKRSKASASTSFSSTRFLVTASRDGPGLDSSRSWIQAFRSGSAMYMYSTPTVPQYVARRVSRICLSVALSSDWTPM